MTMTTSVVLIDDATQTSAAVAGFLAGYCGGTRRSYTTDSHGQTLATFALFDLVGLRLSPRIAKLTEKRLWRPHPASHLMQPLGGGGAAWFWAEDRCLRWSGRRRRRRLRPA